MTPALTSTRRAGCGPTSRRGFTPRPPQHNGTPRRRSTGLRQHRPQDEVEDAVVQVMTYLIENEQAALAVPARFLGRIHPHFREVAQFLAVQVADEARHMEVFSRRAVLHGRLPGTSTSAAARRWQRCWPSRTSRWRRSCSLCWARARSSTC